MATTTKTTPHIAVGVIVLLLILAGTIYFFAVPRASAPTTATSTSSSEQNPSHIQYFCDKRGITAVYITASTTANSSVALTLSDGRSLMLPQVMSGSGIRYEQGAGTSHDVIFSSKGDNAFLTEGSKVTYDNCVAGIVTPGSAGTSTFTDQSRSFSFAYPSPVAISGGGIGYSTDWMVSATTSGLLLVKATLPRSFEPKTNLSDSILTIGTSADPDAVANCLTTSMGGNGIQKSSVTINGVTYTRLVTSDAGAGNFYETTSYRTVRNNQCYVIEYTIHSTNIGNYSPDQGISVFDHAKVQNVLEGIVQSFKFL